MKKPAKRRKPNVIGENLRYLLKKQGVKAADLARAIGCYYKTVYFWIHGTNIPDSINREKICDYFGITEAQLLSEGLAVSCSFGDEEIFNTLVRETGLIGVTPDDIMRLGKQQKLILRDLIKDWTDRRSQQVQALTAARLGKVPLKTILIVHNHPGVCFSLKRKLQEFGYRIVVAADGRGGLHCLKQDKPDLALVQFDMSGMDGLEFLKKSCRKGRKSKMIVIAKKKELARIQKERIPIDGHLEAPFDLEDLLDQIQKLIGNPT